MEATDLKALENYWKDYHYHKNEVQLLQKACTKKALAANRRYQKLIEIVEAVESVFDELTPEYKKFAEARYLGEEAPFNEWADVADLCGITVTKGYKMRAYVLTKTGEKLGYVKRPIRL